MCLGAIVSHEPRIDFVGELANTARANPRVNWELRPSNAPRQNRAPYSERVPIELTRAVDERLAVLEQEEARSFYDAIDLLDYQDALASEFSADLGDSPSLV